MGTMHTRIMRICAYMLQYKNGNSEVFVFVLSSKLNNLLILLFQFLGFCWAFCHVAKK